MSKILYPAVYHFLQVARDLYFSDVQALGMENIPVEGPLIFAANHPNSIMDTVLLGTQTTRKIHYLARSGLFKNPAVAWLFRTFGAIPLYRAQDGTDMSKNASSFDAAYATLEEGHALGIFPEGQNSKARQILKVKTGTARIALGAEARNDFGLGVKIVPVGINFLERDRFLTSVLLRFGEPIDVTQWRGMYEEDDREAVRDLTDRIQEAMQEEATHIDNDLARGLSEDLIQIAGQDLLEGLALKHASVGAVLEDIEFSKPNSLRKAIMDQVRSLPSDITQLDERFKFQRYIADIIEWMMEHNPTLLRRVTIEVKRYKDHLDQVSLRYDFSERDPKTLSSRKDAVKLSLYALCFGPFAGWGFLHNAVPYYFTRTMALRAPDEAIRAFTGFCVGIVTFIVWYSIIATILWLSLKPYILPVVVYMLTLPPAGYFFLRYRQVVATYRDRVMLRTIFRTERNLLKAVERERDRIIKLCGESVDYYEEHYNETTDKTDED